MGPVLRLAGPRAEQLLRATRPVAGRVPSTVQRDRRHGPGGRRRRGGLCRLRLRRRRSRHPHVAGRRLLPVDRRQGRAGAAARGGRTIERTRRPAQPPRRTVSGPPASSRRVRDGEGGPRARHLGPPEVRAQALATGPAQLDERHVQGALRPLRRHARDRVPEERRHRCGRDEVAAGVPLQLDAARAHPGRWRGRPQPHDRARPERRQRAELRGRFHGGAGRRGPAVRARPARAGNDGPVVRQRARRRPGPGPGLSAALPHRQRHARPGALDHPHLREPPPRPPQSPGRRRRRRDGGPRRLQRLRRLGFLLLPLRLFPCRRRGCPR